MFALLLATVRNANFASYFYDLFADKKHNVIGKRNHSFHWYKIA